MEPNEDLAARNMVISGFMHDDLEAMIRSCTPSSLEALHRCPGSVSARCPMLTQLSATKQRGALRRRVRWLLRGSKTNAFKLFGESGRATLKK